MRSLALLIGVIAAIAGLTGVIYPSVLVSLAHNSVTPPILYAAAVLQIVGEGDFSQVFEEFLRTRADESKDYHLLARATKSLRDAYLDLPAMRLVAPLRDLRHEIRKAAFMALIEHPDARGATEVLEGLAHEEDSSARREALQILWARGVFAKGRDTLQNEYRAIVSGDVLGARSAWDSRTFRESALTWAFSSWIGDISPRNWETYPLQYRLRVLYAKADGDDPERAVWGEMVPIRIAKLVREDPELTPLKTSYKFRVVSGMELPRQVSGLNLPALKEPSEKPLQSSEGTVPKVQR